MKIHYLVYCLPVIIIFSCKKNDTPSNTPIQKSIIGYVQKGPFVDGSSVTAYDLTSSLSQSGKSYSAQISNNNGSFSFNNIELTSNYCLLKADGFYYNEVGGTLSSAPISLYGLSDLSSQSSVNVNLLTHLEKDRVINLIANGSTYAQAKHQAQKEILKIFGIEKDGIQFSENLNIAEGTDDDAILLAISCIIQISTTSEADLTELLSTINNDIKNDGILDDQNILYRMFNASVYIDTNSVKSKLYERYQTIGSPCVVPNFVKYLNEFIANNAASATTWGITFPKKDVNLLIPGDTVFHFNGAPNIENYYNLDANIPIDKSLIIKLYELNTNPLTEDPHFGYYVQIDGPPFGFILPVVVNGKYCATISPELINATAQLFPYHTSTIRILQPGQYLMEYYLDGSPTPVFTKKIEFQ